MKVKLFLFEKQSKYFWLIRNYKVPGTTWSLKLLPQNVNITAPNVQNRKH